MLAARYLTNADPGGYSFHSISISIADSYLGIEPKDWVSYAATIIERQTNVGDSVTTAVWNTVK